MRRFADRNRDMGFDPMQHMNEPQPVRQLEPKDERLLELSEDNGRLRAANDLISEDNGRLEQDNRELREENKRLRGRNEVLENARAKYEGATEMLEALREDLQNRNKVEEKGDQ